MAVAKKRLQYDCGKCVAFCCSIYERVEVTAADVRRLAKHYELTTEQAKKRFTIERYGGRILRRRKDSIFDSACRFLHPETRGCTIYEARPKACREYPGLTHCSYYNVLEFEREIQEDRTIVPVVRLMYRKTSKSEP